MVYFQANRADVVTLDAGEVYTAVKQFGLTAIAKEIYSDGRLTLGLLILNISVCLCQTVFVPLCSLYPRRLYPVCGSGEE